MTSCSSFYYQLYKTVPSSDLVQKNGSLVYEDENCQVSYNFWSDKGNVGFRFYNKTDDDIYLNLPESYFVINGIANNYFKDRVFTQTGGSSVALISYYFGVGLASTNNTSVSKKEEDIICIPSLTSKIISEYLISETIYRDCDLFRYPTTNQIKTKEFTKENSPLVFSNRLTYWTGKMGPTIKFSNEFYVTEITNYPQDKFLTENPKEFCNEKTSTYPKVFKNPTPDKFYIKYSNTDYAKH